jgi:hypothetical protein
MKGAGTDAADSTCTTAGIHFSYSDMEVASSKSGATCTTPWDDGSLIPDGCLAPVAGAAVPQPDTNNAVAITASVLPQPPRFQAADFFHIDMTILLNYCWALNDHYRF